MTKSSRRDFVGARLQSRRRARAILSGLIIITAGAMLASCANAPKKQRSSEYFSEEEYGVAASPRVVDMGEPVPKGGGRYQVGDPYVVKGKTYRPKEDPDYEAVGLASWYGSAFHGRKTANGEVYDMAALSGAHPTLPLPSYVRVTNLGNDRSVVVRVNDRGPFEKGRVIDVSATAAEMLGFRRAGTAKVKVEYVGPARMDGRDRQMLLASYRGPNVLGGDTMIASNPHAPQSNVILASAHPVPTPRPGDNSLDRFGSQPINSPAAVSPAFMPVSTFGEDPLGPLILRTGFTMSYAPTGHFSRAHEAHGAHDAIAELVKADATLP